MQELWSKLELDNKNSGAWSGTTSYHPTDFITSMSPVDGNIIGHVGICQHSDYDNIINRSQAAFSVWRNIPAPKRGDFVRQLGDELRKHKE